MDETYVQSMKRLVAVVQELSLARRLEDVQAIVRRAARALSGADGATFVLREGDQCFYADEEAIEPLWKGCRFPMSACISGWVMQHGRNAVIPDIYADERIPADVYRPTFVKSLAMVPIRRADPIGAIGTYWASHRMPDEAELEVLRALADSTSIALENVQLFSELQDELDKRNELLQAAEEAESSARRELEERERAETALRDTEQQLQHAQKMEAVGQLAGGIAHDFNNVLSVILSYASLAGGDVKPEEPLHEDLEEIRKAGEKAAALTRQLLAFSRQQVTEPRMLDLNGVLIGMERMVGRLIAEDVQLSLRLGDDLDPVFADAGQIEQVVMNLVVNARDAMPRGGQLTIETQNVDLDGAYAGTHLDVTEGSYVLLAVSDSGTGMDPEVQKRIFDPFFTTKEKGQGTGLGLSTAYGIVKQNDGHIWVYSEPGHGTTFKIYFPKQEGRAEAPRQPAISSVRLSGTETILLAEDDEQLRAAAGEILGKSGYHVLEARNGGEALLLCENHAGAIHLLVTDVVMPQMSGVQLAHRLAEVRPGMKVLCMSGYADGAAVRHGVIDSKIAFLQKPIAPRSLLGKVRQVLDG